MVSRSKIDKAGRVLSRPASEFDENYLNEFVELEGVFDKYRESHLAPLTKLTAKIQGGLLDSGKKYYIAQRLKRKPQIIRKLNRLSVRLTQLQDIGGLRIVLDSNDTVDEFDKYIQSILMSGGGYQIIRTSDYRIKGRDDSGYRALHKIIKFEDICLELQIRSNAQHIWAESVERTSVFYGKRIKEGEGSSVVIGYFKLLSDAYSDLERGVRLSTEQLSNLEKMRSKSEEVIRLDGHSHLIDSVVNQDVIKTLIQKERSNKGEMNNWILVFDWKSASFVTWDIVSRDSEQAVSQYVRYEKDYPENQNYEVVLIGSSDISTVQKTHSHYFGLSRPDKVIEDMGYKIFNLSDDVAIDAGAKRVISTLSTRKIWGFSRGIQKQTLKNHFCKDVDRFDECLSLLIRIGFVIDKGGAGVTLDISKSSEILKYT